MIIFSRFIILSHFISFFASEIPGVFILRKILKAIQFVDIRSGMINANDQEILLFKISKLPIRLREKNHQKIRRPYSSRETPPPPATN